VKNNSILKTTVTFLAAAYGALMAQIVSISAGF
jgi:hypothetical protein